MAYPGNDPSIKARQIHLLIAYLLFDHTAIQIENYQREISVTGKTLSEVWLECMKSARRSGKYSSP